MPGNKKVLVAILGAWSLAMVAVCMTGCGNEKAFQAFLMADNNNNRVLMYERPYSTNQAAAVVLGQPDSTSGAVNNGGLSASSMSVPNGVAQGPNHEILVMDPGNCRVLFFEPPFSTGMAASIVLGEPDGATANCVGWAAATASSLDGPAGAAVDSHGNLWVADRNDSRVLMYSPPFTTGMAATLVLGQTATDSASGTYACNQASGGAIPPPTAGTLCLSTRLAFDASENLWVLDRGNNRVLMYPPAQQKQGGVATLVIGQANFTSSGTGTSPTSLDAPQDLAFDPQGNLWVSDLLNNRVLKYMPPFTSGMAASAVLGQTNFLSSTPGTTASTLNQPVALAFDSNGTLVVTDAFNNRSLSFPKSQQITGGSASIVFGQPDFTSGAINQGLAGPTANTERYPTGVAAYQ